MHYSDIIKVNMHHSLTADSINQAFIKLSEKLLRSPDFVVSPRNLETKELISVTVQVNTPRDRLVANVYRKMSLKYLVGEWLWYERGSNSIDEISYYSPFWRKISDDGKTVNSAYGHRLFGFHSQFGVNQWEYAKGQLTDDINTRRAIMLIPSPVDMVKITKDFPCTISLQFLIRDNKLHLICNMRSNDLVLGFTYDAASFTMFQEKMLIELQSKYPNLKMGYYYHFAASLHVYQRHYPMLREVIYHTAENRNIRMPEMRDLGEIKKLQHNEEKIRLGQTSNLFRLTDPFCIWCQDALQTK